MDISHQRHLVAAQGYSELGLPDLALVELSEIPEDDQHECMVVETRLAVLIQVKRYQEALPCGRELCHLAPDRTTGFIHVAFCLHELGNTLAARELLLSGPSSLKSEPTYYYNLACYEAVLGNFDQARAHLGVSFAMDRKLREHAHTDPDLAVLRDSGALFT
jgi:predicted Zn-dependent protease